MAATAMTMRSNVASMGDMAFLERKIFRVDIFFSYLYLFSESMYFVFNLYEVGICILNNSETE